MFAFIIERKHNQQAKKKSVAFVINFLRSYPGKQIQEDGAVYNYGHSCARRV